MIRASRSAACWLAPILPSMADVTELDVVRLGRFEETLRGLLPGRPTGARATRVQRSAWLASVRDTLAASGDLALAIPASDGGSGRPVTLQALLQFVCGYHDIDLRDSTGLGHGHLIARHGSAEARARWLPRLLSGDIAGIAVTEAHGGSQVHATATAAVARGDGSWVVTGTKTWISRLHEAAGFVVFFTDPAGGLTAGTIDAKDRGLHRRAIEPAGLSGWSWGELRLEQAVLRAEEILGCPGQGMDLLREHFASYRPLVAATALGAAAAAHDQVAAHLRSRRQAGMIADLRDNALMALGGTFAQINAALLGATAAHRLAVDRHQDAELWGCIAKAHGVDTAHAAASRLTLLAGAPGFTASSPLVKTLADLSALRYADGIHDTLYRFAGRVIAASGPARPLIPLSGAAEEEARRGA
jgi:alkylation response protein AidB-like acyl-CoA dehydrogenase